MSQPPEVIAARHPRFSETNLVWVDMEMSGLNPDSDRVIEVAVVVTDAALDVIAEGPALAIRQEERILLGMDSWNTATHGRSGLTERVRVSELDEEVGDRPAPRVPGSARAARQGADVRQLDLPGPSLHGALDAAARGVSSITATSTSAR